MALSLKSIYEPVNDFFINKFKTEAESPVFFRFDKFGSAISDADFIDSDNPEDTGLAQETFSDLVNCLAVADPDGINIFFGGDLIDSEYNTLLTSSIPFVDPNDPNKEEIINTFSKIKSDANFEWEKLSIVRGAGIMGTYRASFATPSNWYDRSNNEIWSEQSFEIKEDVSTPAETSSNNRLWKYKLDDAQLLKILPVLKTVEPIQPIELRKEVIRMAPVEVQADASPTVRIHRHTTHSPVAVRDHRTKSQVVVRDHRTKAHVVVHDHRTRPSADVSHVRQNLRTSLHRLSLTNRRPVLHYIRENAPTQPSTASRLRIDFKYCKVNIRRPWLMDSFTKNKSWFIPGFVKGQETLPGPEMNLSILPIGFIAIKDLSIEANWSQVEISASKDGNATDFGPFEVNSEIINNKLSHEGIQIVGWILQKMSDLPPNNPPQ